MVYDTQNEDPERGEYRSLYSDQGPSPSPSPPTSFPKIAKTNPKDEHDEDIETPSTTPLYIHSSTTNIDNPNPNSESKSKPNPRRRSWIQFQQNLRLPTSTRLSTIAKAVFGALGFIIGVLVCTLAIISLVWGCGEVVNHIRHIGNPSTYRCLSDYITLKDDIDDPYPYPNPYSYYSTDHDTVPEVTTTGKDIKLTCKGEAGACEGSLLKLMRIPKATSVAVIMVGGEGWSDIHGRT